MTLNHDVILPREAPLPGPWRFLLDSDDLGEAEGWYSDRVDRSGWMEVAVPATWDRFTSAMWSAEAVGWYATEIPAELVRPELWQRVRFGRVMFHTKAWLNGEPLGENVNGYLPFEFDVTGRLKADAANVLVLRSMTKDYALAGLRLGYAVGPELLIAALSQVRPAWNVNALAQAAGVAALSDQTHLSSCLAALTQGKEELMEGLAELGWVASPSVTHYFLVPVGDAASLRHTLLQHRILVRDCASFGLPAHIRVATRRHSENTRLLEVLREVRHGRSV
jgi:hypothetical protein